MIYEDLTSRITAEYKLFLFALNGQYQQLRAAGVAITPRSISSLHSTAIRFGDTFLISARQEIDNAVAVLADGVSPHLAEAISNNAWQLTVAIHRMVVENISQIVRQARTGVGGMEGALRGKSGAVGLLVQRLMSDTAFVVTSESGRKWSAMSMMRVQVRDFAYQAWIDGQAESFIASGHDLMETTGGEVFSLLGSKGYWSFEQSRQALFHPNSNNQMVPHVPS